MRRNNKRRMSKNEESDSDYEEIEIQSRSKRKIKPKIKIYKAPEVKSLTDLITLAKDYKIYKNIDTIMLWKILPHLEELNCLIGMEKLKESIFFQVIYYLQGLHLKNQNDDYLHTAIFGESGSGKTQVAKIIGKLYQGMGILSPNGPFKIAYRDDFISGYLGQSAIKTRKLLSSCLGGVLFIDEAYSLGSGNSKSSDKDSFAREACDTLCAYLSENKHNFCCIIAGYEDEIVNRLFSTNRGLERRFAWKHTIDPYTSSQLCQIFMKLVSDMDWQTDLDEICISKIINDNKNLFKFNGGSIETFITQCKMAHSRRVFTLDKKYKYILTQNDIDEAMVFMKKNSKDEKHEDKIHLDMYM
jgi:SpoVK/Ycf46/Vps4 family AAA+-type ATPase